MRSTTILAAPLLARVVAVVLGCLLFGSLLIFRKDVLGGAGSGGSAASDEKRDGASGRPGIRQLSQHFNEPDGDYSPWTFVPKENLKDVSTSEHPGLATIREAGKGKDIKGILKDPIRIDDYPLPWEFQTSLVQSFSVLAGVGAKTQYNTAIGLNVAVTFSDPATWPKDRTQRPPDTKEFQLLVVHLGCTGEAGVGLPQYSTEPHPETYLVWGRGDLGYSVMGDWRIPYVWIGDGAKYAGPASPQLFFRCVVKSPTSCRLASSSMPRTAGTCETSTARTSARSRASGRSGRSSRRIAGFPTSCAAPCRKSKARIRCSWARPIHVSIGAGSNCTRGRSDA